MYATHVLANPVDGCNEKWVSYCLEVFTKIRFCWRCQSCVGGQGSGYLLFPCHHILNLIEKLVLVPLVPIIHKHARVTLCIIGSVNYLIVAANLCIWANHRQNYVCALCSKPPSKAWWTIKYLRLKLTIYSFFFLALL